MNNTINNTINNLNGLSKSEQFNYINGYPLNLEIITPNTSMVYSFFTDPIIISFIVLAFLYWVYIINDSTGVSTLRQQD